MFCVHIGDWRAEQDTPPKNAPPWFTGRRMGLSLWNLQIAPGVISWEKYQGAILNYTLVINCTYIRFHSILFFFHGAHQHISQTTILILFVLLSSLSLWSEKGLECLLNGVMCCTFFSHKPMENQGNSRRKLGCSREILQKGLAFDVDLKVNQ